LYMVYVSLLVHSPVVYLFPMLGFNDAEFVVPPNWDLFVSD